MSLEDLIPEDMEGREALLSKFGGEEGVAKLAKSYLEMESFRGRSVPLPKEGADDKEWREAMARFGAPAEMGEYKLPEGMDDDAFGHLREPAFNAALTQRQFDALASEAKDRKVISEVESQEAVSDAKTLLREELGSKYDQSLAQARRAARQNGVEGDIEADPVMFKLLAKMGSGMTESAPDGGDAPQMGDSAKKIAGKLRELMASDAYSNSFHGEHEAAMMAADTLREELSDAGYTSVFHPDLISPYSPFSGVSDEIRPWQNPNSNPLGD